MCIAPCTQETKPSCRLHARSGLAPRSCMRASTIHVCIGTRYCLIKRHPRCNCIEARRFMYDEAQNLVQTATKPQSPSVFHRQVFRGKYLQSRVQSAFCGRACVRHLRKELFKDYSVSNASAAKQIFELDCKLE